MRTLVINRGAPGCGKTTFLKNNNLQQYSISADSIRLLFRSPILNVEGEETIAQIDNKKVFNLLFQLLQDRMKRGEFVIVDCTNSTMKEIDKYKKLCKDYRYRLIVNDFTHIPIDVCKERNRMRSRYEQVDDCVIDKFYERFKEPLPENIKCVKPENLLDEIQWKSIDLCAYNKVHCIGDIHGCFSVLMSYMPDKIPKDEFFIFLGDYVDRGIENAEVIKYLCTICNLPNVILLEGNHEKHLWDWANNKESKSSEFNKNTAKALESHSISKKDVRMLYRKLHQLCYFKYYGKTILVTHGGLPKIPDNLTFVSNRQIIQGVGTYEDADIVDNNFEKCTDCNYFQVHGHRNITNTPLFSNSHTFNLENSVEFGGNLRIVTFQNPNNYEEFVVTAEIQNKVFKKDAYAPITREKMEIDEFIKALREDKGIDEKQFNHISSFQFSRDTWSSRNWNPLTTVARGLFINTHSNKIVSRSYDKFFNINEIPQNKLNVLPRSLDYPVTFYEKYNGYLGIIGYDEESDSLIYSSKNTLDSEYALNFKAAFDRLYPDTNKEALKALLKRNNISLVFEVILPKFDPHIIKYDKDQIILLDAVKREINFKKLSYDELVNIATNFNFEVKKILYAINTPNEFEAIVYLYNQPNGSFEGRWIEGFVIEDSSGRMVKLKSDYYNTWKHIRTIKDQLSKDIKIDKSKLSNLELDFVNFLSADKSRCDKDIITVRDEYIKQNYCEF